MISKIFYREVKAMRNYNFDAIVNSNIEFLNQRRLRFQKIKSKKDIRTGNKRLVGILSTSVNNRNKTNE